MSEPVREVYIALASVRVAEQAEFYRKFLKVTPRPETAKYAEFQLPGLRLAIFEPKLESRSEFAATGAGPMGFCVEVDDLPRAIAHLTTLGYPPPGEIIHASHGQEIYAYDPDGNRLILHQSSKVDA